MEDIVIILKDEIESLEREQAEFITDKGTINENHRYRYQQLEKTIYSLKDVIIYLEGKS